MKKKIINNIFIFKIFIFIFFIFLNIVLIYYIAGKIRKDLGQQVAVIIHQQSLKNINYSIDGRNLILKGSYKTIKEKKQASIAFKNIWGIHKIFDNTIILSEEEKEPTNNNKIDMAKNLSPIEEPFKNDDLDKKIKNKLEEYNKINNVIIENKIKNNIEEALNKKIKTNCNNDCNQKSLIEILKHKKIFFFEDTAIIKPNSKSTINEVFDILQKNPQVNIAILGYADSKGKKDYNQRLAKDRAKEIKNKLKKLGITEERLQTDSFGEDKPLGNNKTINGRKLNRRVEFKII